ncbi:hypothetical protein VZO05_14495 [Aggregatilineales bacterium SYSU G02658]
MTSFIPPSFEKEKRKEKEKRANQSIWPLAWLMAALAISGAITFFTTPQGVRPTPTPTWTPPTPAVVAFNAPVEGAFPQSSVSAQQDWLAQVAWHERDLRWRAFRADENGQWLPVSGGTFEFPHPITRADISPDGQWLLVMLADGSQSQALFMRTDGMLTQVDTNTPHAALSLDGKRAVVGDAAGKITFYSITESGALIAEVILPQSAGLQALALQEGGLIMRDGRNLVRYDNFRSASVTAAPLISADQTLSLLLLPSGEAAVLTASAVTIYDFQGGYRRYELGRLVQTQHNALIASRAASRLAVLHPDGLTLIRIDDSSPLTPDANQAALSFWPIEGVQSAAFVDDTNLLAVSTEGGLHLLRDGQIVQTLPDEWPITASAPSGR